MLIKDILNYNLITCDINSSIKSICELMQEHNIGFVPITNDNNIIGVITDRDIVIRNIALDNNNLKAIISTNLIHIDSSKEISDALKLYKSQKIKRLLVKENDKFVGVLSISDVIKSEYNEKEIYNTIKSIFTEDNESNDFEVDSFYL